MCTKVATELRYVHLVMHVQNKNKKMIFQACNTRNNRTALVVITTAYIYTTV